MSTIISRYGLLFVIEAVVLLAANGDLFSPSAIVIAAQVLAVANMMRRRRHQPRPSFAAVRID